MAFDKVTDFNDNNHKIYIDYLNKEWGFSINKNSEKYTLFLEAITSPSFAKKYNESKIVTKPIRNYDINEFKGDGIITYIVITEMLKDQEVGEMHNYKKKLTENKNFIKMFDRLKLERFMFVDNAKDIGDNIKADMIESLSFAMHEESKKQLIKFLIENLDKQ